jgi:glycosyltransferase involved in cell wall biosynthesis
MSVGVPVSARGVETVAAAASRLPQLPKHVAIVAFEGPDRYAAIGGLGTRVSALARALGQAGRSVELFFIGDPAMRPVEVWAPGVTLRRWCGWISANHPRNAYDGEAEKIADCETSLPGYLTDFVVAPAAAAGERVLIMIEEWQMANVAIALDQRLRKRGLRGAATILWNANNVYGFERVFWGGLKRAAAITAVSRFMKFELARRGVPALVVPNGIDERLLPGADPELVAECKTAFRGRPTLFKVGRFDPDKNWLQAVDALAELHAVGIPARLIVRGGKDPYSETVFGRAHERGLPVERMAYEGTDGRKVIAGLAVTEAPIVHVRAFLDERWLCALYSASDAVLANSGKEPFGLVGLEVMAAGGVAVCGSTGEEYADPFVNALVCDTSDGNELATYLRTLYADPKMGIELRARGKETAARYAWQRVLTKLERKVAYVESRFGR